MLKFLIGLTIGLVIGYSTYWSVSKEKRLEGAKNAAEWGCYQGAWMVAYSLSEQSGRYTFLEDSLQFCPGRAEIFKQWLRNGK
jgi:NhaP-type Na+/H+ or K+/H+ antiporter